MIVARRRRVIPARRGPCLALLLVLACSPAVMLPPAGAQATAEDRLEETSLLPALWRKLVDSFAAVGASVSSVDEHRRLTILHVEVGDLVAAKQGLSRQLGVFLAAPSEAAWAKVSARLPVLMDNIREIVAHLRKEGEAGSALAREPVFKELRGRLADRHGRRRRARALSVGRAHGAASALAPGPRRDVQVRGDVAGVLTVPTRALGRRPTQPSASPRVPALARPPDAPAPWPAAGAAPRGSPAAPS